MARYTRTVGKVSTGSGYFGDVEPNVRERLREIIERRANEIAEKARTLAPRRKGKVQKSIKVKMDDSEYGIYGLVGTPYYIGRFWEQGFGGKTVRVKAHVRRVKAKDVRAKVMNAKGKMRSKIVTKGSGEVKAHERKIPRQHKPYLKVALDEIREQVYQEIRGTILSGKR